MARFTLSQLSDLWEQRGVSDEEYVAALRERIEELEKQTCPICLRAENERLKAELARGGRNDTA